jgi:hypothetical protein
VVADHRRGDHGIPVALHVVQQLLRVECRPLQHLAHAQAQRFRDTAEDIARLTGPFARLHAGGQALGQPRVKAAVGGIVRLRVCRCRARQADRQNDRTHLSNTQRHLSLELIVACCMPSLSACRTAPESHVFSHHVGTIPR